ncbi:MAG: flagellar export protein FliJ [Gemmatimonadaceae bacterium]
MSGPRFTFRLQRVLELREAAERGVQRRLAAAQEQAAGARELHDALAAVRDAGAESLTRVQAEGPTAGTLRSYAFVQGRLDARLSVAEEGLQQSEAIVDAARQELTEAFRARRVIDRLRERREEEWRAGEAHADLLRMDAIALSQHGRGALLAPVAARGQDGGNTGGPFPAPVQAHAEGSTPGESPE